MERIIKINKCRDCPKVVSFQKNHYACSVLLKEVKGETIDKDCKLAYFPRTVSEFLGDKI